MSNTILIDKILIHMLDLEHGKTIYSDTFINLVEGTTEYYDKKIEKCLENSNIKQLIVVVNIIYYRQQEKCLKVMRALKKNLF